MVAGARRWAAMWLACLLVTAMTMVPLGAAAAAGDREEHAALFEALGIGEILVVMREEGLVFGAEIGADFLPGGGGAGWSTLVQRIYDPAKMRQSVEQVFDATLEPEHIAPLLAFFSSEAGKRIVAQEVLARRAFLEPGAEESARLLYRSTEEGSSRQARLKLIGDYVAANDLVEFNVAGGLNSNLRFYRGLIEGGAWEMTEDEMLSEVWGQEDETRADTIEWLMAYLMMAYDPLPDSDIRAYLELSETPHGQALNSALFAAFDAMYGDLSYALGLAVAVQMKSEDL